MFAFPSHSAESRPSFAVGGLIASAQGMLLVIAALITSLLVACGGGGDAAPVAIKIQPVDASVVVGQAAVFSVTAPGATAYQWQSSIDAGANWADIAGATTASLTADAGAVTGTRFRVIVTAPSGARLTSSAVTLTVSPAPVAPSITVQPADQTVVAGGDASFSVTAAGTTPTYRWQSSTDGGTTYADIVGATQATIALPAVALATNNTLLRVVVNNGAGTVTSRAALLTVQAIPAAPTFTLQPVDASVTAPAAASFTLAVVGNPTPALQWQVSTNAGATFADIAGQTAPTLTLTTTSPAQSGNRYRASATNSVATNLSAVAVLTVGATPIAPAFTLQPANASVIAPTTASFGVVATGAPTPTLQWQLSVDGGATFANINGATGTTFMTAATSAADDGKRFRVIASNTAGSMTSASALLSVALSTGTSVGPAGGTVNGPNGSQLVIPPGALSMTIDFSIMQGSVGAPTPPVAGYRTIGAVYTFTPHGTTFSLPASIRIPYDAASITDGATPQLLKAEPGGAFAAIPSTVNGNFVEGAVSNLSYFSPATFGLLRFSNVSGKCGRESLTGTIWCWGGQGSIAAGSGLTPPGNNQFATFATPTRLSTLAFGEFVAGYGFVCGVHATDVYCIGDSEITREANPPAVAHWVKMSFPNGVSLSRLTASGMAVCGIVSSGPGTAYCWGSNLAGALGRGSNSAASFDPDAVMGGSSDYISMAGAGLTFCALRATGTLECWGAGNQGEIPGSPSFTNLSPVAVPGVQLDPRDGALAAGANHMCGLRIGGAVLCWGLNFYGQIGIGTAGNGNVSDPEQVKAPVIVPGLLLASLRLVGNTTCGLTAAQALFCWGHGTNGTLGNGTHPNKQTTPVAVATPFFSLLRLSGSDLTVCGMTTTAEAYCWGDNTYADLGTGLPPPLSSDVPVKVWDIGPFPSLP